MLINLLMTSSRYKNQIKVISIRFSFVSCQVKTAFCTIDQKEERCLAKFRDDDMNSGFSRAAIRVRYPNLLLERGLFYSELYNTFIKTTCYTVMLNEYERVT